MLDIWMISNAISYTDSTYCVPSNVSLEEQHERPVYHRQSLDD